VNAEIADARDADLPAIRALLDACALPTSDLDPARVALFVARDGSRVVGCVGLDAHAHADAALLRSLAVAADRRGARIADALCTHVVAVARARGVRTLVALTTTAAAYFRRRGYVDIARAEAPASVLDLPQFASLCPSTATVLRLALVDADASTP
jgi:amino-acid N-acetyltransferase